MLSLLHLSMGAAVHKSIGHTRFASATRFVGLAAKKKPHVSLPLKLLPVLRQYFPAL